MSTKGKLTRSAAIDKAGLDLVIAAESDNCEPTNRCGYNGSCQDDALIEWRGSASGADTAGEDITVEVYYYTDEDQEAAAKASGWDCISWDIGEDITVEVYYYTDEDQEAAAKASGWDCISWDIAGYEITD